MLIKKLSETVGDYQAEGFSKYIVSCDKPKRSNSHIIYSIDAIERAISERKKISFLYYSLDAKKQKVYRKDGKRYITNPLVMVWSKDNYYLIAYPDHHDDTTRYRIDKMENVQVEEIDIVEKEIFADFDIEKYRAQVFSMFGGELKTVELQITAEMIDSIYDKFGEDIKIYPYDADTYKVIIEIQVSPTFYSWVAGTRGKVRILTPAFVKAEFQSFIEEIKTAY